jgi:hypothetical protein
MIDIGRGLIVTYGTFKIEMFTADGKTRIMNQWTQKGVTTPDRKRDVSWMTEFLLDFTEKVFKDFP